jgi:lipopolysaccharide export LptBFGC system permease protein LptF
MNVAALLISWSVIALIAAAIGLGFARSGPILRRSILAVSALLCLLIWVFFPGGPDSPLSLLWLLFLVLALAGAFAELWLFARRTNEVGENAAPKGGKA